jgi:hypothetical protein
MRVRLHIRATQAMQFSKAQLEMGPASGPDHATAVRAVAAPVGSWPVTPTKQTDRIMISKFRRALAT